VELGDFQGQVCAAGQQAGVRVGAVDVGQVAHRQRRQATLVAAVQLCSLTRFDGFQLGNGFRFAGVELVRLLTEAGLFGGFKNGAVAGAAAEVAGQGFVSLVRIVFGHRAGVLLQGKQAHDEAGGAEAAL